MKKLQALFVVLAWPTLCSSAAHAQTWSGASGGTWATASNWNSGSGPVPGAAGTALFNTSGGGTVSIGAGTSVENITFDTAAGAFTLSGGSLLLTSGGELQIASTITSTSKTEAVSSAITLEGNYTFANNAPSASADKLTISGAISSASGSATTLSLNSAAGTSSTISGPISDGTSGSTMALSIGGGTWTLSGTNTFSGGTTIGAGTLVLGASGGTTGSLGTGNVSVASGANLTFAEGTTTGFSYTFANNISGAGSVTKSGTGGLLFLTGANSYTGATLISAGILNVQSGSALGNTSGVTVASGTTLQLEGNMSEGNVSLALAGAGATTGGLTATGALENVSGTNTYAGLVRLAGTGAASTTISSDAGTLNLTNTGTITGSGDALTLTGAGNGSISSSIGTGAGTVTVNGPGTWTLAGTNNSYTGATTVAGGTLNVTGILSAGSAVTVGNGSSTVAILSGTGTINGSVTTVTSGSKVAYLAPGVNSSGARNDIGSAGTLHIGGALTLGAGTNLDFDLGTTATPGGGVNDLISMTNGVLTLNGTSGSPIVLNVDELGGSLTTGTAYTLISGAGSVTGFNASDFSVTGDNGYTATFSLSGTSVDVTFSSASVVGNAYFNGLGNDLNTAGNYDAAASGNSANSQAPTSTTNVFFSANRNTSTTPNLSASLAVNSLNFGTGTGTNSGITVSSSSTADALTIEAGSSNGNTAGNGITVSSGSDTISAPVILGASQTWTVSGSSSLNVSGQVSDAGEGFALTEAGTGTLELSNATGNTFSGGTTVSAGTLILANTSGSATGSGALNVGAGAVLAGTGLSSGSSFSITGSSSAVATVLVGHNSASDINTTGVMSLSASGAASFGSAKLVFNLNSNIAGQGNELSVGKTAITFNTIGSLNTTMSLNIEGTGFIAPNTAYVLVAGTGTTIMGDTSTPTLTSGQYSGLETFVNARGQDQIVTGSTSNLTLSFANSTQASFYGANSYLFIVDNGGVDDIEVEVVPEPGTWALMTGGLALLVFWQRRKSRLS